MVEKQPKMVIEVDLISILFDGWCDANERTLSNANENRKLMSWAVSSTDF